MKKALWTLSIIFLFLTFTPVVIVKKPYEVITPVVEQGGSLSIIADFCKWIPLRARYQITYVGELRHSTPELYSSNVRMGCDQVTLNFTVPGSIPPGKYHIEIDAEYPPIIRPHQFESEEFTVTQREDKLQSILDILQDWEEIK